MNSQKALFSESSHLQLVRFPHVHEAGYKIALVYTENVQVERRKCLANQGLAANFRIRQYSGGEVDIKFFEGFQEEGEELCPGKDLGLMERFFHYNEIGIISKSPPTFI